MGVQLFMISLSNPYQAHLENVLKKDRISRMKGATHKFDYQPSKYASGKPSELLLKKNRHMKSSVTEEMTSAWMIILGAISQMPADKAFKRRIIVL